MSLNSLEKLCRRISTLSIDELGELWSFLNFYAFFEIAPNYG